MTHQSFRALVVRETSDGTFSRTVEERAAADLPDGDLLVRVVYSSLNYKDALSASGHRGVTRRYPHTPGVDAAGEVVESRVPTFRPGDQVLITGHDLGMNTAGGFGQYIRVPADWAVRRPAGLSLYESMILGTAGFTAAMSVERLLDYGVAPGQGEVLVTGATGGVGSIAVALLAQVGFRVVAATGKLHERPFLEALGAAEVVDRADMDDRSGRPLLRGRWAGVVDTVGGSILATAIKSVRYGGAVACCGLVASPDLVTTVYPFILRGVTLMGIDSAGCGLALRQHLWERLAGPWKLEPLPRLAVDCPLDRLDPYIDRILAGRLCGRVVVRLWPDERHAEFDFSEKASFDLLNQ